MREWWGWCLIEAPQTENVAKQVASRFRAQRKSVRVLVVALHNPSLTKLSHFRATSLDGHEPCGSFPSSGPFSGGPLDLLGAPTVLVRPGYGYSSRGCGGLPEQTSVTFASNFEIPCNVGGGSLRHDRNLGLYVVLA